MIYEPTEYLTYPVEVARYLEVTKLSIANKPALSLIPLRTYRRKLHLFLDHNNLRKEYFTRLGKRATHYFKLAPPDRWISDMFRWDHGNRQYWADKHTEWLQCIYYFSDNLLLRLLATQNIPLEQLSHYTGEDIPTILRWLESKDKPKESHRTGIRCCFQFYTGLANMERKVKAMYKYYDSLDIIEELLGNEAAYQTAEKESSRPNTKWITRAVEQVIL